MEPNEGSHPEGKKAKARQQMNKSLEYLTAEPMLGAFIYSCTKKVFIIGWRDYNFPYHEVSPKKKDFSQNLQAFMTTPSSMANQLTAKKYFNGNLFHTITVKYPQEYEW